MMTGYKSLCCLPSLAAALLLGLSPPSIAVAASGQAIGEAYDLENDELLYREVYCAGADPDQVEVIYSDSEGQLLARKKLDYSSGAATPSFVQHNIYSSEVIEVGLDAGKVTMSIIDAESAEPKKVSSSQANGKLPLVIDAGFDEFVRAHWDSLTDGDKKSFLFPFAERSRMVELRIKPTSCSYGTETDQCFRLEMSNWFIRMLVAPIELGYDPEMRRLTRYRGLSNIGDGKGGGSIVDIRYDYPDVPSLACAISDQVQYFSGKPNTGNS